MSRSRVAVLAISALVCVAMAVVGGRVGAPAAADVVVGAGETVLVSPVSLVPTDDPSDQGVFTYSPALSGDGLTIAYGTRTPCCGTDGIQVRDLASGTDTALDNPDQDRRAPSISADGHLVSFQASDTSGFNGGRDVYVANLSGTEPVEQRVTGLASAGDLPFQRQAFCNPDTVGESEGGGDPHCGPRLSADGTALVIPAFQSITSPQLTVSPNASFAGNVVDFGPAAAASTGTRTITVTLTASGHEPLPIDGLTELTGPFQVAAPDESGADFACTDSDVTLDPRNVDADSCAFDVDFTSPAGACGTGALFDRVTVSSSVTGAQIELMLFAQANLCPPSIPTSPTGPTGPTIPTGPTGPTGPTIPAPLVTAFTPTINDASCPPPSMPDADASRAFASAEPTGTAPVNRTLSDVEVGQSEVQAQQIDNTTAGSETITFQTADCAIRLVHPINPPTGNEAAPCATLTIPAETSCTIYFRFAPTDVTTYGAMLSVSGEAPIRYFGDGARDLLLLKRDPTATGAFFTPGEVVSVDETGAQIPTPDFSDYQPAISSDGRFVSFTAGSHDAAGRFLHERVLVRDTVARRTRLGSVGVPANGDADESAISGDGQRVAYTTWVEDRFEASHVQVRDLRLGRTVQVSDVPGIALPNEDTLNRTPALSLDGSTVAFVSDTDSLTPAGQPRSQQVYVRDLGPDFGGPGTPQIELASPLAADAGSEPNVGQADAPAVDETGASIAFISDGDVIADPPPLNSAVYARHRFGSTAVAPTSLAFADQPVGSVGPAQAVTVRNDGPGPSTVDVASAGPFALTNGCAGVVLHRGESCSFTVASAPTEEGPQSGTETVTTGNPVWDGTVTEVGLTGNASPAIAQMLVQPETIAFAPQVVGTASAPAIVTATNISTLPMTVSAVVGVGATEFVLGPADPACANLGPGASCRVTISFIPSALGVRTGRLDITGAVGTAVIPRQIPITGTTATPTLEFSPTVVQEGRVTFLTGENFLPGVQAQLQWSAGLTNLREITPDARGRFKVPLVLLTGAPKGERILTVRMPTVGDVKSEPLLVVSRSAQPPDFERD